MRYVPLIGASLVAVPLLADTMQVVGPAAPPRALRVNVLAEHPHDTSAFTQGLLWYDGKLYESTGMYGQSSLRRVDLETGSVEQRINLESQYFGEGLTRLGEELYQIVWRRGKAFVYDRETFDLKRTYDYTGEGWGLEYDGRNLLMTDGSAVLQIRDPQTFDLKTTRTITMNNQAVRRLNEIEYVDGTLYGMIWQTDTIIAVDPETGRVTQVIDASGLLTPEERRGADVLNGIAYNPGTGTFYITGKYWPKLFEVEFVPR